jgi:hypothetical protein
VLALSIHLHPCHGATPPSTLSSRPKRTRISYFTAPNNGPVCGSLKREPHEVHRSHKSRQEIRGSGAEGSAVPLSEHGKTASCTHLRDPVTPPAQTADPSAPLRFGRDDKVEGGVAPWQGWRWMDRASTPKTGRLSSPREPLSIANRRHGLKPNPALRAGLPSAVPDGTRIILASGK